MSRKPQKRSRGSSPTDENDRRPRASSDVPRPLLLGGERLPVEVDRGGGGGEKFQPFTPEQAFARLRPQVEALQRAVTRLDARHRGHRVIVEAQLLSNYLAGSHFPKELVRRADFEFVGTRNAMGSWISRTGTESRPTKTLLLSGSDDSVARLGALINDHYPTELDRLWMNIIRLDVIQLPPREHVVRQMPGQVRDGELVTWEAVLHPQSMSTRRDAQGWRQDMLAKWEDMVRAVDGQINLDDCLELDGLTFVPVALTSAMADEVARFNPLRCLRVMPTVRISPLAPRRSATEYEMTPPPPGERPRSEERVAIFDGGVDLTCPFIAPFVRQFDLTDEPPADDDVAHGAAVTSTTLFGYPRRSQTVSRPHVAVDHFRVLPLPRIVPARAGRPADDIDRHLYWLIDQITHEVRRGDYRLVNLSIGPRSAVDEDAEPNAWTATLDLLARERNVLFVTAAGNDGERDHAAGLHRVQVPADMVNGLGVGACTGRAETPNGRVLDRCSYSSSGPGRWGARVRPAGLAFGGLLPESPFVALLPHGTVGLVEGTSFSAPLVSHSLTELVAEFGSAHATPAMLRAFAIHFAQRRPRHHLYDEHGYGRFPEHFNHVWNDAPDRVTVLYEDALRRDSIAGFRLPLPLGLPAEALIEIWWTVCVTAPVSPRDSVEYTKAGFELLCRPDSRCFSFFDRATHRTLGVANIETERAMVRQFIRAGAEQSKMPVARTVPRAGGIEQGRREAGKWETTIQQRLTRIVASTWHMPTIEISYLARESGALQADADALPFSMLVSARVHGTSVPYNLYETVRAEFPALVPLMRVPIHIEGTLEV